MSTLTYSAEIDKVLNYWFRLNKPSNFDVIGCFPRDLHPIILKFISLPSKFFTFENLVSKSRANYSPEKITISNDKQMLSTVYHGSGWETFVISPYFNTMPSYVKLATITLSIERHGTWSTYACILTDDFSSYDGFCLGKGCPFDLNGKALRFATSYNSNKNIKLGNNIKLIKDKNVISTINLGSKSHSFKQALWSIERNETIEITINREEEYIQYTNVKNKLGVRIMQLTNDLNYRLGICMTPMQKHVLKIIQD